jgi:hypothetical protein
MIRARHLEDYALYGEENASVQQSRRDLQVLIGQLQAKGD